MLVGSCQACRDPVQVVPSIALAVRPIRKRSERGSRRVVAEWHRWDCRGHFRLSVEERLVREAQSTPLPPGDSPIHQASSVAEGEGFSRLRIVPHTLLVENTVNQSQLLVVDGQTMFFPSVYYRRSGKLLQLLEFG